VTLDEFKAKYPNITQCIEIMGEENDMRLNKEIEVPLFLTAGLEIFEIQAAQLSDDEKEILATGGDDERDEVVKRTGFEYFDDFLSEAFEGILSSIFWTPAWAV
jgi:hypothetical protein